MVQLGRLADQQTPLLQDLQRAAPSLTEFFTRLGPFSEASRPAFKSLGQTSLVGRKALNDSRREVDQLAALSASAPQLAKPLRQFLQTLDDRGRSVMDDPRAAASAPPAPDPTAYHKGQGFTGFEAFWNYVYVLHPKGYFNDTPLPCEASVHLEDWQRFSHSLEAR